MTNIMRLIILLVWVPSFGLTRLDPHGSSSQDPVEVKSLKGLNQCTVCHEESKGRITVKGDLKEVCFSCHNKAPHSGAADHIGKMFKGEKISCQSCHFPHRWENKMVKKNCSECHKW